MKQTTRVAVLVDIEYDDDKLDQHEAQQVFLQGIPNDISCSDWGYRGTVTLNRTEIIAGLVDEDCVPVQPRA